MSHPGNEWGHPSRGRGRSTQSYGQPSSRTSGNWGGFPPQEQQPPQAREVTGNERSAYEYIQPSYQIPSNSGNNQSEGSLPQAPSFNSSWEQYRGGSAQSYYVPLPSSQAQYIAPSPYDREPVPPHGQQAQRIPPSPYAREHVPPPGQQTQHIPPHLSTGEPIPPPGQ